MSFPFIIWCRQRTGSNSLMDALCAVSEYQPAPPEPFDTGISEDRYFSHISKMAPDDRDLAIRDICSQQLLIRHCYENLPEEFNRAFAAISKRSGYRHIHLQRNNELARLASKGIAEQHGTWIPTKWTAAKYEAWRAAGRMLPPLNVEDLIRYHERCESGWRPLASMQYLTVTSEDLFSKPQSTLVRIACYLDMPESSIPAMIANLGKGQDTPSVWGLIPNIEELDNALKESAAGRLPTTKESK